MAELDEYRPEVVPEPFGLQNTGVICYFNSLLQALASCSAVARAVRAHRADLGRSRTGAALCEFVDGYVGADGARRAPAPNIGGASARLLAALSADLKERRPRVRFAAGQEDAAEGLVHLLDMLDAPQAPSVPGELEAPGTPQAQGANARPTNAVAALFHSRTQCTVECLRCRHKTAPTADTAYIVEAHHMDLLPAPPATAAEFAAALHTHTLPVSDYRCEKCGTPAAQPAAAPGAVTAHRRYDLVMASEIIACTFNRYAGRGRPRPVPPRIEFPGAGGAPPLVYELVAQVEHAGALSGGHYWARARRASSGTPGGTPSTPGGTPSTPGAPSAVYELNDSSAAPSAWLSPSPFTFIAVYHYVGRGAAPNSG